LHEIYNRIIQKTQEMGLNGNEIGKLLGLKKSPLTDWKNGKSFPTTEQIIKLCEIFAVSADYILFGNTHCLSNDESILITNFQKLSAVDKQEILNIIEYKIYKSEEKETLSHTNKNLRNNRLA
jgi:transcriptional regulator with XRE-family HTH domain